MILTTTQSIEGRTIVEYKGIVFGEVISGVNFLKDFGASIRNIIGGRSSSYENELLSARTKALRELGDTYILYDISAQMLQDSCLFSQIAFAG